jgi:hypothetical protein
MIWPSCSVPGKNINVCLAGAIVDDVMSGREPESFPESFSCIAAEFGGLAERFSNLVSRVGVTGVAKRPSPRR